MSRLDRDGGRASESLPATLASTVAPLSKGEFGVAVGCVTGIPVFLLTAFHLLLNPVGGLQLDLLSQYFSGYDVTWVGAIVGLAWGGLFGFIGGWVAAFLRNFLTAIWILTVKGRAELSQARDFLDQL